MQERVKELNCLYNISDFMTDSDLNEAEIYQRTVEVIPPSWQYPEITVGRIVVDGEEYTTDGFVETEWRQVEELVEGSTSFGRIEVFYTEERPEADEGPFLKEECHLIDVIAERLTEFILRRRAERSLYEAHRNLERRVEEATEEVRRQSEALMEMSTPVISVWRGVLLMPLIGVIDTQRAQQVIEVLLQEVVASETEVVILDVTGVPVIDTSVAQHLLKAVAATRMLGAEVILTGFSPEIAQTLVQLDVDFAELRTRGSLRAGIAEAFRLIGRPIGR